MHKYDTPLTIGSKQYDGHFSVKGQWNYQNRTLHIDFGPIAEEVDGLRVATQVGKRLLAPSFVASLDLQDNGNEPVVTQFFLDLQKALETLEEGLAPRFTDLFYQIGEEEYSLKGQFIQTDKPAVTRTRPEREALDNAVLPDRMGA